MNKRDLYPIDLVGFFHWSGGGIHSPFVVRYNGLSLIAMSSLDIVITFFDIIIRVWSHDNKQCLFLLSVCMHCWSDKVGGLEEAFQVRISYS